MYSVCSTNQGLCVKGHGLTHTHTHPPVRPVVRLVTHVREIETNYQDELGLLGQAGTSGMTRDSMLHGTSRDCWDEQGLDAGKSRDGWDEQSIDAGTSRDGWDEQEIYARTSRNV